MVLTDMLALAGAGAGQPVRGEGRDGPAGQGGPGAGGPGGQGEARAGEEARVETMEEGEVPPPE